MGILHKLRRAAFKPLYRLYYRTLFGGDSALARRLHPAVRAFEGATGRGDAPVGKETWEAQYGAGDWQFLHDADERERFRVAARLLAELAGGGKLLDVGCGEGMLLAELGAEPPFAYAGLDLSEIAVERARERFPGARFLAADAEAWPRTAGAQEAGPFDAVFFGESLYYFEDPLGTAAAYQDLLRPGGLLLASMFASLRADAISRVLDERLLAGGSRQEAEEGVENAKGRWTLRAYRKPPS